MRCKICLHLFADGPRTPHILPCGHSACRHCLHKHFSSGSLQCPFCRRCVVSDDTAGDAVLSVARCPINYDLRDASQQALRKARQRRARKRSRQEAGAIRARDVGAEQVASTRDAAAAEQPFLLRSLSSLLNPWRAAPEAPQRGLPEITEAVLPSESEPDSVLSGASEPLFQDPAQDALMEAIAAASAGAALQAHRQERRGMRFPAGWLVHAVYVFILGLVVITSFLPGHRASPLPVVVAHYIRSRLAALLPAISYTALTVAGIMLISLHAEGAEQLKTLQHWAVAVVLTSCCIGAAWGLDSWGRVRFTAMLLLLTRVAVYRKSPSTCLCHTGVAADMPGAAGAAAAGAVAAEAGGAGDDGGRSSEGPTGSDGGAARATVPLQGDGHSCLYELVRNLEGGRVAGLTVLSTANPTASLSEGTEGGGLFTPMRLSDASARIAARAALHRVGLGPVALERLWSVALLVIVLAALAEAKLAAIAMASPLATALPAKAPRPFGSFDDVLGHGWLGVRMGLAAVVVQMLWNVGGLSRWAEFWPCDPPLQRVTPVYRAAYYMGALTFACLLWLGLALAPLARLPAAAILLLYVPASAYNMARRPALNRPDREVHDVLCASDVLCVLLLPRFHAGVVEAAIHAFGRVYVGCAYDLEEALRQEGAETRSAAGVAREADIARGIYDPPLARHVWMAVLDALVIHLLDALHMGYAPSAFYRWVPGLVAVLFVAGAQMSALVLSEAWAAVEHPLGSDEGKALARRAALRVRRFGARLNAVGAAALLARVVRVSWWSLAKAAIVTSVQCGLFALATPHAPPGSTLDRAAVALHWLSLSALPVAFVAGLPAALALASTLGIAAIAVQESSRFVSMATEEAGPADSPEWEGDLSAEGALRDAATAGDSDRAGGRGRDGRGALGAGREPRSWWVTRVARTAWRFGHKVLWGIQLVVQTRGSPLRARGPQAAEGSQSGQDDPLATLQTALDRLGMLDRLLREMQEAQTMAEGLTDGPAVDADGESSGSDRSEGAGRGRGEAQGADGTGDGGDGGRAAGSSRQTRTQLVERPRGGEALQGRLRSLLARAAAAVSGGDADEWESGEDAGSSGAELGARGREGSSQGGVAMRRRGARGRRERHSDAGGDGAGPSTSDAAAGDQTASRVGWQEASWLVRLQARRRDGAPGGGSVVSEVRVPVRGGTGPVPDTAAPSSAQGVRRAMQMLDLSAVPSAPQAPEGEGRAGEGGHSQDAGPAPRVLGPGIAAALGHGGRRGWGSWPWPLRHLSERTFPGAGSDGVADGVGSFPDTHPLDGDGDAVELWPSWGTGSAGSVSPLGPGIRVALGRTGEAEGAGSSRGARVGARGSVGRTLRAPEDGSGELGGAWGATRQGAARTIREHGSSGTLRRRVGRGVGGGEGGEGRAGSGALRTIASYQLRSGAHRGLDSSISEYASDGSD